MMTDTIGTSASAEALAERLFGAVLGTIDVYAVYLGERLGYYRELSGGGWLTPADLADRSGTAERYAREWLEQQAVTGVLAVDTPTAAPAARRYALPPGHAEVLTDVLSSNHVLPLARFVVAAGKQADALVEAYRAGGGVRWNQFGADAREAQAAANRPMFLSSLGQRYLRSILEVDAALSSGGRVADVGCGFGWSSIGIALAYPMATVDGFDVDSPSVEAARRNAVDAGVADRVSFHVADVAHLNVADVAHLNVASAQGTYDLVAAFECVHDLPDPVGVLAVMGRLAKAGGTVLVMDERVAERFAAPGDDIERLMYGYSLLCCLPDGLAHQPSVGTGTVMRPDTLRDYAVRAGFGGIEVLDIADEFFRFYRLLRA
jgi:SAM-dependent methyltransferase